MLLREINFLPFTLLPDLLLGSTPVIPVRAAMPARIFVQAAFPFVYDSQESSLSLTACRSRTSSSIFVRTKRRRPVKTALALTFCAQSRVSSSARCSARLSTTGKLRLSANDVQVSRHISCIKPWPSHCAAKQNSRLTCDR